MNILFSQVFYKRCTTYLRKTKYLSNNHLDYFLVVLLLLITVEGLECKSLLKPPEPFFYRHLMLALM